MIQKCRIDHGGFAGRFSSCRRCMAGRTLHDLYAFPWVEAAGDDSNDLPEVVDEHDRRSYVIRKRPKS